MILCKKIITFAALFVILILSAAEFAVAKVSPEEAAKLGTTLNSIGGEMAGNEEGTIPPYTGGLTHSWNHFRMI